MQKMLLIREFPMSDYESVWTAMKQFTQHRHEATPDELWLLEHTPVYTQGLAGKPEHILQQNHIPIIQTDRGGQVTYHGPGQLMCYTLFNLARLQLNTRCFVVWLENIIIKLLKEYDVTAYGKRDAPGVYVHEAKIASIGLRVKKTYAYHGIAFNVAMDLTPFQAINPCGFKALRMAQLSDFVPGITLQDIKPKIIELMQTCHNFYV